MTSLKKLIAVLAVSLPLAASAQQAAPAPAPLYQLYGTLNLNMQWVEVSKPTMPGGVNMSSRLALSTDSSNIGLRGTADTGVAGVGVVWQCETSANLDGEGVSGICNRNSRVGLSHGYGTIFYGNWDSPYKALLYGTKADDPFGNTDVFDAAAIIGSPGAKTRSSGGRSTGGTTGNTLASFNQRAGNSIAYHSPKYEGAQLKAQYSTNEFQTDTGGISPALYSVGLNYDRGPFSIAVAYERHDDYVTFGGAAPATPAAGNHTTDMGLKAGAGIELASGAGATTIGAQYEYLKYGDANTSPSAAGAFESTTRSAYMVGLKHRMGDHEFRLRWEQAFDQDVKLKGVSPSPNPGKNTGANDWAVGYSYYLSKAAQVYVYATQIMNAKAATYTFATGGPAQLTSSGWTAGADPFAAGLGMRYAF